METIVRISAESVYSVRKESKTKEGLDNLRTIRSNFMVKGTLISGAKFTIASCLPKQWCEGTLNSFVGKSYFELSDHLSSVRTSMQENCKQCAGCPAYRAGLVNPSVSTDFVTTLV